MHKLGINLNKNLTEDFILNEHSRKDFENDPYLHLLIVLGGEMEIGGKFINCSDDIWHLDTECIEDSGDYVRIAERLKDLSRGLLNLENINDVVDIENLVASLTFTFKGKDYQWHFEVKDDWLDETILQKFNDLLILINTDRRIALLNLGGQDYLIGIYFVEQVKQVNKLLNRVKFEFI